jgi:rfaE bifunctional protein nucleotidyltransferase chain/domain
MHNSVEAPVRLQSLQGAPFDRLEIAMAVRNGIFGDASNFGQRFVPNYSELQDRVTALKALGLRVVLTQGSFDWLHKGHYTYLEAAKSNGDVLIVGVDDDAKIRRRKGENRPLLPQEDRLDALTHTRYVDLFTLKTYDDPRWALIIAVRPDVLIATETTYTQDEIAELEENYCGQVVILPYTKTVSTTSNIRDLHLRTSTELAPALMQAMMSHLEEYGPSIINEALDSVTGRSTDIETAATTDE